MASDITEEFQVDISNESTTTVPTQNSGITYDIAFNGQGFFDASSPQNPYRRQTAPYKKDQSDNTPEPGEQTLTGWWLRSQSSFHLGAGIDFYEPSQEQSYVQNQTIRFRYKNSEGVDVWTPGKVSLLKQVDSLVHPVYGSNAKTLRSIPSGALLHDTYDVDRIFAPITVSITNKALTSNVATLTTSTAHSLTVQMFIRVSGVGTPFDGDYTITAVTSNTFSYAKTASNVTSTAATGSATTDAIHFIDNTTAENVWAICDDGKYAYWVSNQGSPAEWHLWAKPLTGNHSTGTATSGGPTGDIKQLHKQTSASVSNSAVMEFVKDRLIICVDNKIFEATGSYASGSATVREIYAVNNTDFRFTDITESPADVYISGYQGGRSVIYRIYYTPDATSGIPEPLTAVVVAEMPRAEIVHSIKYYLGYMVIGTNNGVRVAQVQSDGSLVYGPLLFHSEQPVYQIAVADRFAWVTARIGGDTGLIRIDLSTQIDNLVFPYANDLQAVGSNKECMGVCLFDNTDRKIFTSVGTGNVYLESESTLRENGFLETGLIRFATLENKFFKYIKERADYSYGGSIGISTPDSSIITVDSTTGNQDVGVPERNADDTKAFIFTLNRNASTTSQGPILYGYQLKALPATKRQRLVQYNVFCFDTEIDRYRNMYGYKGRAYERLAVFESLEESSDIVTVQDFRTGETFQGLIEETSFTGVTSPLKNFSGFGGILTVTVRKI